LTATLYKLKQVGLNDTLITDLKKITGRYKNENELFNTIDTLVVQTQHYRQTTFLILTYYRIS
jgi:hypothetical protein